MNNLVENIERKLKDFNEDKKGKYANNDILVTFEAGKLQEDDSILILDSTPKFELSMRGAMLNSTGFRDLLKGYIDYTKHSVADFDSSEDFLSVTFHKKMNKVFGLVEISKSFCQQAKVSSFEKDFELA